MNVADLTEKLLEGNLDPVDFIEQVEEFIETTVIREVEQTPKKTEYVDRDEVLSEVDKYRVVSRVEVSDEFLGSIKATFHVEEEIKNMLSHEISKELLRKGFEIREEPGGSFSSPRGGRVFVAELVALNTEDLNDLKKNFPHSEPRYSLPRTGAAVSPSDVRAVVSPFLGASVPPFHDPSVD